MNTPTTAGISYISTCSLGFLLGLSVGCLCPQRPIRQHKLLQSSLSLEELRSEAANSDAANGDVRAGLLQSTLPCCLTMVSPTGSSELNVISVPIFTDKETELETIK